MSKASVPGYPRHGIRRELKFALEKYWAGKSNPVELLQTAGQLRRANWQLQKESDIDILPSNDFSLYDQVLDISWMVGAIPPRFQPLLDRLSALDVYFAMARGWQSGTQQAAAMEMTKWFDTNYHYIVPEISPEQKFHLLDDKPVREFLEAKELGYHTRPVLLGPLSYLLLSKSVDSSYSPLQFLVKLLPVYGEVFKRLEEAGADWVQVDEPCLVLDLDDDIRAEYVKAYDILSRASGLKIMLATYFGALGDNLNTAVQLPVAGLHIDLVRASEQLEAVLSALPEDRALSLGLVDGRNVWRTDLDAALALAGQAVEARGSQALEIASSCSLLFCPYDLELEEELDPEVKSWLAFSKQKLNEISMINRVVNGDETSVKDELQENRRVMADKLLSGKINNQVTQKCLQEITPSDYQRKSPYKKRREIQAGILGLPLLPTTTIGSFPQTAEIRKQRALHRQGGISTGEYLQFLKSEIQQVIRTQEELGLDVLVHGESERTDMVEYFGRQLDGFAFTQHGWVQSYGSRAVRPPVIYGDITRPEAMTVKWINYAQSVSEKPVKGMLTGPITILQWSFVRNDQPREMTARQIALALRDEVADLQDSGMKIIQIDEPALREGLPLQKAQWDEYLNWAIDCFRLVAGVAEDETQIHTHMCYAEFADIITAIVRMDADVISIEASRSKMELLDTFEKVDYPNDIGPGIYDIHSPRVPSVDEMEELIAKALKVIPAERLWVNPDCGLKTRKWEEVLPSLTNMVAAARTMREKIGSGS